MLLMHSGKTGSTVLNSCVAIIRRIQTVNIRTVPHCAYLHVRVLNGIDGPDLMSSAWLLMLHLPLLRHVLNMFLRDGCLLSVHVYRRLHARDPVILELEARLSSETSASLEILRDAIPTVGMSLCPQLHIKSSSIDTGERGWLRHCATSRKVAGSIPDGVIGIFH